MNEGAPGPQRSLVGDQVNGEKGRRDEIVAKRVLVPAAVGTKARVLSGSRAWEPRRRGGSLSLCQSAGKLRSSRNLGPLIVTFM